MAQVFSGYARLTAYTRDPATGQEVYVNDYTALARAIHAQRTFAAYAPGTPYADDAGKPYAMLYWRVVGDPGNLIEDTELEITNQEDVDLNFYVEYMTNDGQPYNNNNLDGRTFGPGKRVVFSAAAFLHLPV
jgi:hypothetical protein